MKTKTVNAIKKSIKHWEENASFPFEEASISVNSCALCDLFFDDHCEGCPIYESTAQRWCKGSPYDYAKLAFMNQDEVKFRAAAIEMVKYLESLLPKRGE